MGRAGLRRAVIIGASIAGLMVARVLAEHFEEVVLVERDLLPEAAIARRGTPQAWHLHILLQRGEAILDRLYPGMMAELAAGGAIRVDFGRDLAWYHYGGWKTRFTSGVTMLTMTRPFLEAEIRRRTLALPRIACLERHEVLGLIPSPDRRRIVGVRLRSREPTGSSPSESTALAQELACELVVDCSGRGSATPRWLTELGYPAPPEEQINVHVGYATRLFVRRPGEIDEGEPRDRRAKTEARTEARTEAAESSGTTRPWRGLYIAAEPPGQRIGVIVPVEGGRWISVMAGTLRDYPPVDLPGFLKFAASLPVPDLHRVLAGLEPADDGHIYRFPANLRRGYERSPGHPDGLCVVGDALCSFNPMYGQGITLAALAAVRLGELLGQSAGPGAPGLAATYHREIAKVVDVGWRMTTLEDLRNPEVVGERPPGYRWIAASLARVHRSCIRDPAVMLSFLRVMHMLDPPTALLRPGLLARVALRGGTSAPT